MVRNGPGGEESEKEAKMRADSKRDSVSWLSLLSSFIHTYRRVCEEDKGTERKQEWQTFEHRQTGRQIRWRGCGGMENEDVFIGEINL